MGIRPNGDGAIPPVTPDNPESRYSAWLTDLEDSGEIVGGVWQETDAKATSANNAVSDLAGRVGNLENAPVKPHTHSADDITGKTGWVDSTFGIAGRIPVTGSGGFLHSRDNPTSDNHLARKGYVDSAIAGHQHTHTSSEIADRTSWVDSTFGIAGRIPITGSDGFLYSRDNPTADNHLARKGYVDSTVAGHRYAHTHPAEEITGKTGWVDSTFGIAGRIPVTGTDGFLHSRDNPTHENHLTRKGYVDALEARVAQLEALLANAVIAAPPATVANLPTGQVYLDTATLTIHTKD